MYICIYVLLFCEILSHLHVMVLDNQYNALSAGVSIQWETIHFMHFKVWLRCNSEGLGSPQFGSVCPRWKP